MTLQRWRNRLVEELCRQGLPRCRVNRLVEELTDHAKDLLLEKQSMDVEQNLEARLGSPEQLASVAKDQLNRSTFAGRHPVLTFVAGPIFTMTITFKGTFVLFVLLGYLLETSGIRSSEVMTHFFMTADFTSRFVSFLLSKWLFEKLGQRSGRIGWSRVALGIIVWDLFTKSMTTPGNIEGTWTLMLTSTGIGPEDLVIPIVFWVWMYWQSSRTVIITDFFGPNRSPSPATALD